jgi:AraC-like DNA-binding protein
MAVISPLSFTLELSQIIVMVTSFVLAFLLWFIKVPSTEYSRRLLKTKNSIAICFFVCAVLLYACLKHVGIAEYGKFSALMMFIVTSVSSVVLSFSLINLLEERDNDRFYLNLGAVILMSWLLMRSFLLGPGPLRVWAFIAYIALFVVQAVIHIVNFNRAYLNSLAKLEHYYDDEETHKIKWIRFCYTIMMLTQTTILVYIFLPDGFMKIYSIWYVLFLVYFTANFISFLGSHKLLLDAFAYKALTFQNLKERIERRRLEKAHLEVPGHDENELEFRRLEKALEKWVEEKRYRDYDKSRDEIARELSTTKEMMHLYFADVLGVDFKSWRTLHRVEDAKTLLLEKKNLSVNMIGELAGFSDRSNFHRQFTRIVGCSPKKWRDSGGTPD